MSTRKQSWIRVHIFAQKTVRLISRGVSRSSQYKAPLYFLNIFGSEDLTMLKTFSGIVFCKKLLPLCSSFGLGKVFFFKASTVKRDVNTYANNLVYALLLYSSNFLLVTRTLVAVGFSAVPLIFNITIAVPDK